MATDIFNFESPDLVNLQRWQKNLPKEFGRAVSGITNTLAFQARTKAIENIKRDTITRSPRFVGNSMRVEKSRPRTNLNQIISEMGSIDLSGRGLSSGFEELETGSKSKSDRVPTLLARAGGKKGSKVSPAVRFKNIATMHRHTAFGGRGKRAKVAVMLKAIRARKVDNKPFIIPRGLSGSLKNMPPGIWRRKGKDFQLMNPFDGKRGPTKRISWMQRAIDSVASRPNLLEIWRKEIDFRLARRR